MKKKFQKILRLAFNDARTRIHIIYCTTLPFLAQYELPTSIFSLGDKMRKLKVDFMTGGTWHHVGQ